MPASLTYPGVYVEEIPSGVRTIAGVATSITAFIGRARRGPMDKAVVVNNFGDFDREFGGLWEESPMTFAVRDFFLNGGSQAIIVRAFRPEGTKPAKLEVDGLHLAAASPGTWGNKLRVRVDHLTRDSLPTEAADTLFNLSVKDTATGRIEMFRNVSVSVGHPRRIDGVLENESSLLRINDDEATPVPNLRPDKHVHSPAESDPFGDSTPDRYTAIAAGDAGIDGDALTDAEITADALKTDKRGMYALEDADLFNILCIPPHKMSTSADAAGRDIDPVLVIDPAVKFCRARRAFFVIDPPYGSKKATIPTRAEAITADSFAAQYFPTLLAPNPFHENQVEEFAPCGAIAGVMARTDAQRGVWKAPAGVEATIAGISGFSVALTDAENGELNPLGINCLRAQPGAGSVVWGARTLEGSDRRTSEWKYIPVRRTALYIEESVYRGTQWVVFEPNDEPLWAQIRLNIGAFMYGLFRQGAFQGKTPAEAYLVKCDKETTTQDDINRSVVNIIVGFAPLKPAEFVVIKLQQLAGQILGPSVEPTSH